MNPRQRVKEIFEAALDCPPNEREQLLVELCANDDFVRTEVEALLNAHAESDGFLSDSPLDKLAFDQIPALDLTGRRIGVYELQSEIGQGGMATVYLAERTDGEYRQQVALKLVSQHGPLGEITRRFKRERQILASLDHPNIARLLGGGTTEDGRPYLVMEYIAGQPITHFCRKYNLSLTERLRLFQTVCAAVAYAHRNLVIHRDIKPGNILVTPSAEGNMGTVKLLDFGIAKLLAPGFGEQKTITGLRPLTPHYASPEQLREETITTATDVYSLGVLLYELLTRAHPHDLKNRPLHEVIRQICEEDAPPPSSRASQLRGDLDNIILLALRKDPRQRYQTVEQFSEDISRYLAGEAISARPATLLYRTGKFARRNKTGVAIVTTILFLLLAGLFFTLRQNRMQRYQLYAADMRQAGQDWAEGNLVQMGALLEAHRPGTASDEWRGFEWFTLWKLLHIEKFTLHHQAWVPTVVYTPDSKMILTGSRDGRIEIWDARNGRSLGLFTAFSEGIYRLLISNDGKKLAADDQFGRIGIWNFPSREFIAAIPSSKLYQAYPVFSPDSKQLALKMDGQPIQVWDANNGQLIAEYFFPAGLDVIQDGPVIYAPDGRLLCLTRRERQWELWDVIARRVVGRLDPQSENPRALITYYPTGYLFSRDGQRLYLATRDFMTRVWDLRSGKLLHVFDGHQAFVETPALSHDDKLLATGSDDKTLRLWDTQTGKLLATVKNESQTFSPVFSPDDKFLAAVCMRAFRVKVWDVTQLLAGQTVFPGVRNIVLAPDGKTFLADHNSRDQSELFDLSSGQPIFTYPIKTDQTASFSPDGKLIALRKGYEKSVEVLETASGKTIATLKGHSLLILAIAFSPDGKTLATAGQDRIVKLWDTATWRERANLVGHTDKIWCVGFSPDGSKLASGGYDDTVRVWDTASGNELMTLRGHRAWVPSVKFSPDGKLLASASWDYTIKLWDASTGRELRTLTGNANSVYTVAFSPDGNRLASGGDDQVVRIWDVPTGEQLTALTGHTDKVWQVYFTPDGQTLISASGKETLVWRAATEDEVWTRDGK